VGTVAAVLLAGAPPALAVPDPGVEERIAVLDGRIAAAEAELTAGDQAAARVAEDYNEAREAARAARAAAGETEAAAIRARSALAAAHDELGILAAEAYRVGRPLELAEMLRTDARADDLLDGVGLLRKIGEGQDARVQRLTAAAVVADVLRDEAAAAAARAVEAERAAEAARRRADDAHRRAAAEAERLLEERVGLVEELAAERGTALRAEISRQEALSAVRAGVDEGSPASDESAADTAESTGAWVVRNAADPLPTPDPRPSAPPGPTELSVPPPTATPAPPAAQPTPTPTGTTARPTTARPPTAAPTAGPIAAPPRPAPAPVGSSRGSAAGGLTAVSWARTQLGKAYLWGGEGPDAYDCSGLVLRAWRQGGVALPHSSRMQYQQVAKIDSALMRPGDLLFWGSDPGDPSSIHHVAVYAGNGMMIEAPNSRNVVREVPVRWSGTMPYAGRP
jgi:cell wall-associated NlpC family hydrolase